MHAGPDWQCLEQSICILDHDTCSDLHTFVACGHDIHMHVAVRVDAKLLHCRLRL